MESNTLQVVFVRRSLQAQEKLGGAHGVSMTTDIVCGKMGLILGLG